MRPALLVLILSLVCCGGSSTEEPRPARDPAADRCAVASGRCECESLAGCSYLSNCHPNAPDCEQGTTALGAPGDECHASGEKACTIDRDCPEGMRCRDLYSVDLACNGLSTLQETVRVRRCTSAPPSVK